MAMLTSTDFSGLVNQRFVQNLIPIPARPRLELNQRTPDFELPDITYQRRVRLSEYHGDRPVILALTRIFTEQQYCPLCFPHIKALDQAYSRFTDRGVEVLMITSTDSSQSQVVVQDLDLQLPLLSDPSCQTFRQYGVGQALGAPLPGQFVLDQAGKLRFVHLFSFLSNNASPETLLEQLDAL
jgi:peroxiredoxin